MRCIIIEDEAPAMQIMQSYVEQALGLELLASFRNPLEAIRFMQNSTVDLLFIDINMPGLNGLEFVRALPQPPLIIFTTAYSQYAIDSYDLDAVDYLLKPIQFNRFLLAVNKAMQRGSTPAALQAITTAEPAEEKTIFIKSGNKTYQLPIDDILYVEAQNNYVKYVSKDKKILSLDSLSRLEEELPAQQFVRVHKSYLVAINKISSIQHGYIEIQAQRIRIGRAYKTAFLARIDTIGRQGN